MDHTNTIGGSATVHGVTVQTHTVHGGIHTHVQGVPPVPVPRQLLPVSPHFTDRESDIAALDVLIDRHPGEPERPGGDGERTPRLVVVTGPAGVGKTALVTRWLHRGAAAYPDGHLYADLRGHAADEAVPPGEVLGRFLRAIHPGPVPADTVEKTALWRSLTAGLRLAVMLDNVYTAAQARPLLPGSGQSLVAVTGRRRLTGLRIDGALFHPLGLLPPEAAEELLVRGIGRARADGEPGAARRVVKLCAGLPLAVCIASARLAARPRQPVGDLADALARDQNRLAVLAVEGEPAVRSALDASYAALDAPAARLYRLLGQLPLSGFGTRSAAAAAALPLDRAGELLDALVEANLVEDTGPDRYRFHDLIGLHARERGAADESADARTAALRRVCDWYLATTTEAQKLITPAQLTLDRTYASGLPALEPPFTDEAGALRWLADHQDDLRAVLAAAEERGWDTLVWQLVDAMWPLFLRLRVYDLWITAHEAGLAAARHAGHAGAERQMLNSGAIGLSAAGRPDDAISWYEQSRAAARRAGDRRDEGQALLGVGAAHFEAGRHAEAVTHLDRAVALWEETGYRRGVGLARIVLGEVALAADDAPRAVAEFEEARVILLDVRDPHDATRALAFLGRARARAGQYAAGMERLREALGAFEESGAVHWQARTLEMIGLSAQEGGDPDVARDSYERARALFARTNPGDAARVAGRLAASGA
ncbi:tetratricopeptide repeat protein [Streptomyces roseolilacinus]|uniref:tetratricopeptide repeat protein n=1 Tax=Streptomyces roseolilacinus TaxID=66904 RepID=UPI00167989B8|nr:tetratricopeptide repeat protein [Streptomyces roseolilacinus]